jgi:hypothetical protein
VWTEGANSTRVSTRAAATGVVPAPTTGVVVLQHPFVDGIFYKGTCRMDLPGPTASVGTRTDYSVGPWNYPSCATRT